MATGDDADAAARLLEGDGARQDDPHSVPLAATIACEQLTQRLAEFVGSVGARALYDRTLAVTRRERVWLAGAVAPKNEPPWPTLRACLEQNEPQAWDGSVALLANLIALFSSFVGSALALRILHGHRPDAFPLPDTDSTK